MDWNYEIKDRAKSVPETGEVFFAKPRFLAVKDGAGCIGTGLFVRDAYECIANETPAWAVAVIRDAAESGAYLPFQKVGRARKHAFFVLAAASAAEAAALAAEHEEMVRKMQTAEEERQWLHWSQPTTAGRLYYVETEGGQEEIINPTRLAIKRSGGKDDLYWDENNICHRAPNGGVKWIDD